MPPDPTRIYDSPFPFEEERIRAVAVYCSDGRLGVQFDDLLHNVLGLPRYDRLAVPGGAACLASNFQTYREQEALVEQLRFLIDVHGLERVVLIAHENCAFYSHRLRVSPLQLETKQREDMLKAVGRVNSLSSTLKIQAFFARIGERGGVRFEQVDV